VHTVQYCVLATVCPPLQVSVLQQQSPVLTLPLVFATAFMCLFSVVIALFKVSGPSSPLPPAPVEGGRGAGRKARTGLPTGEK